MSDKIEVILGATSGLAQATARELAATGATLVLVARDSVKLAQVGSDLEARGATVRAHASDLADIKGHEALMQKIGDADHWWVFYGTLPDQSACQENWAIAAEALNVNFVSAASLLTRIGNQLEAKGRGSVSVVSSVAGDRGRQSNYVYGAAKGALSLFCQGLRNRLSKANVHVMTVKPGFIDTPMTADIPKKPAVLWVPPEKVASDMVRARSKGRDVIYTPWFWRYILLIICSVPERIFKKLSL